jgi:hypothetical protein
MRKVVKAETQKPFNQAQFVYFQHSSYRARARPKTPAAPARLIARPPVAAGAPAVELDVPECEAELVEEPVLEREVMWVAVEVKVKGVEAVVELWPVERGVDEE